MIAPTNHAAWHSPASSTAPLVCGAAFPPNRTRPGRDRAAAAWQRRRRQRRALNRAAPRAPRAEWLRPAVRQPPKQAAAAAGAGQPIVTARPGQHVVAAPRTSSSQPSGGAAGRRPARGDSVLRIVVGHVFFGRSLGPGRLLRPTCGEARRFDGIGGRRAWECSARGRMDLKAGGKAGVEGQQIFFSQKESFLLAKKQKASSSPMWSATTLNGHPLNFHCPVRLVPEYPIAGEYTPHTLVHFRSRAILSVGWPIVVCVCMICM